MSTDSGRALSIRRLLTMAAGLSLAVIGAGMAGCAATPGGDIAAEHQPGAHAIECYDKEANCYRKAEALCPKGYTVTDKSSRATVSWRGFATENTIKYDMTVECKP